MSPRASATPGPDSPGTSFLVELDRELARRRVPAPARRRIAGEYADHLACDPGAAARLGVPDELARTFAAELAADDARRVTGETLAALCLAAVALVAGQLALGGAGGSPRFDRGTSTLLSLPAIVLIVLAPQVAFIAGSLGAVRAWRRRRARTLPDAEVRLIHRRCRVAAAAGSITCAGLLLYAMNFTSRLPAWWLTLQLGLAAAALAALAAAWRASRSASPTWAGVAGVPEGLAADVPRLAPLLARPRAAWALAGTAGLLATAAFTAHAEGSLAEGLQRGAFEGVAIAVGLGAAIAIARGSES